MTPNELAARLCELQPDLSPGEWQVDDKGIYRLSVVVKKRFRPEGKHEKLIKNVCVLSTAGIKKTKHKIADAEFIVLMKNNLTMVVDALEHSTRVGHSKPKKLSRALSSL